MFSSSQLKTNYLWDMVKTENTTFGNMILPRTNKTKAMRCIVYLMLAFLPLSALAQITTVYEAENAVASDSIKRINDPSASGGKCLFMGKEGTIQWTVDNPARGWYRMAFRYRAVKGDLASEITINNKKKGIGFSMCNNWNDAWFKTYLPKGKNVITLSPVYGNVEIDYLNVPADSIYTLPSISPVNGVFYKDHPATMTIFADAGGKKLSLVTSDDKSIEFQIRDYPFLEGAFQVVLTKESLLSLPLGNNTLRLKFADGSVATYSLLVKQTVDTPGLTIIMFDVEHGNSVLVLLPDGKKLLIDSGKEAYARSVVMPFLDNNSIDTLDYFITTHYHDDHTGARDEIIATYKAQHIYDYKSFHSGDTVRFGEVIATILNAYADGTDENLRSLSFLLNWNGFTYSHGADNYAENQSRILKQFGNAVAADVFFANHHFHGSVNPTFIAKTNPALVVVSAQQALYARGAYMDIYKEKTEKNLFASHARLMETLFTLEVGTVVVRVQQSGEWHYETYRNNADIMLNK
jgi:beta-lactamase superfamily II metal-dependent hydrolase